MALIVGGGLIGELRGKLGGQVYSRNRGGAYVRQYVVPVNPDSTAQVSARNSFGSASSSYHSLTPTQKNEWNSFAENLYQPKNATNNKQFSGFNAFTALYGAINNAIRLQVESPTMKVNGVSSTPTVNKFFKSSLTPPEVSVQANLALLAGGSVPFYLLGTSKVLSAGGFSLDFQVGDPLETDGYDLKATISDGNDNSIGWAVYISNPVQQSSMFMQNPEVICLGFVPNLTFETSKNEGVKNFSIIGSKISPATYQNWVNDGDNVRLSVYNVTSVGQLIRVSSVITQVTSS